MNLKALHANYQPVNLDAISQQYAKPAQNTKKKPWYTALLSESGGLGGAIGGAAAGTALLPGLGTLLGAAIGGFGGGFGGSAVEQKVRDNKVNWKKAGLEGGLDAVLMPGPLKLAKAGTTAGKAYLKNKPIVDEVNQQLTKRVTAPAGGLSTVGSRLESRATGIGVGEKAPGRNPLTLTEQTKLFNVLDREGIKARHPEKRLAQIERKMTTAHSEMENVLANSNRRLTVGQRNKIADDYLKTVKGKITSDENVIRHAEQIAKGIRKTGTLKGQLTNRRELDKTLINWSRNPEGLTPGQDRAAKLARDVLNKNINKMAPELRDVNKRYSDLATVSQYVVGRAGRLTRASESQHTSLSGRVLGGDMATTGQAVVGNVLRNVPGTGALTAATTGARSPVGYGVRALAGSGLAQSIMPGEAPPIETQDPNTQPMGLEQVSPEPNEAQPEYSLKQALAEAQQILGDNASAASYLSYAKALMDANKVAQPKAPTATAHRNMENAASGLRALGKFESILQSDPGARTKTAIPGRGLLGGALGGVLGTSTLDAASREIRDVLTRLRTGAALNKDEMAFYAQQIPQAFDPPETVQYKLSIFRDLFRNLSQSPTNNSPGDALNEALSQSSGLGSAL